MEHPTAHTEVLEVKDTVQVITGNADETLFPVSGQLLITEQYCNGAAPSQEMLDRLQLPHPLANAILIVREGTHNKLGAPLRIRTQTDANGRFSFSLPRGNYCLSVGEKENARTADFYQQAYREVDKPCDNDWLEQCDLSFAVADKAIENLSFTMHRSCFVPGFSPCISYSGPWPP